MRDGEEVRVTDETTGGQKGSKLAQLGALDPETLLTLAKVAGFGAEKYEAHNFLRGYDWDLSFNAMQRHALTAWAGEDLDPESGLPHWAHAAWNALTLLAFYQRGIGNDTRPPRSSEMIAKLAAAGRTLGAQLSGQPEPPALQRLQRGDRCRVLVDSPRGWSSQARHLKAGAIGVVRLDYDPDPLEDEVWVKIGERTYWLNRDDLAWVAV